MKKNNIPVVCDLDLDKYLGKWYEIAKFETKHQMDLDNVTATYSLKDNGKIKVHNVGYKNGRKRAIKGSAWLQDKECTGSLYVRFFWPFKSDYQVIHLPSDYRFAVVMGKEKDSLWILSRSPKMKRTDYKAIVKKLKEQGFQVNKLMKTKQNRDG